MNRNVTFLGSSRFCPNDTVTTPWRTHDNKHTSQSPITEPKHPLSHKAPARMLCWPPSSVAPTRTSFACLPFSCPASPRSTMQFWALQPLQGPEAKFRPKIPRLCGFRAKQNCLEKMDCRIRSYYSTAQGQLYFQRQQVVKVPHFWQEHLINEIQTIVLWTWMFFNVLMDLTPGPGWLCGHGFASCAKCLFFAVQWGGKKDLKLLSCQHQLPGEWITHSPTSLANML